MRTVAELALKADDRRAIDLVQRELRQRFSVARVILFGSKARGEDVAESDIDLLVLTTHGCPWREKWAMTAALGPIQREFGVVFSLLIVSESEWYGGLYQVLPIRMEIDRDGVAA
jgi:predicted nucleotidyltransferase